MALRTTPDEVKTILGGDAASLSDPIVESIIQDANTLLDSKIGTALTDAQLASIEKWLTAHMIASSGILRQTKEETLGQASVKYTGEWGMDFKSTTFGQMVLVLDTTGLLSKLGKKPAKFRAIPTDYDSLTS